MPTSENTKMSGTEETEIGFIKDARSSHTVSKELIEAFEVLGVTKMDKPTKTDRSKQAALIWEILIGLGISDVSDVYKGLVLPMMMKSDHELVKDKLTVVPTVLAVCAFYSMSKKGHGKVRAKYILKAYYKFVSGKWSPDGKDKERDYSKLGDLPKFDGQFFGWLRWKESALGKFTIWDLKEVTADASYAEEHEKDNEVVHALLINALKDTDGLLEICGAQGDGHKTWKNLCDYFENKQLIQSILNEHLGYIRDLKLTDPKDWSNFVSSFRDYQSKITTYITVGKKQEISLTVSQFELDYADMFLQAINIPEIEARIEKLKNEDLDEGVDKLWHCIVAVRSALVEKGLIKDSKSKKRKVHFDEQQGSKNSVAKSSGNQSTNGDHSARNAFIMELMKISKAAPDSNVQKQMTAIIDQAKAKTKSYKGNKEGKKRPAKRRKATSEVNKKLASDPDTAWITEASNKKSKNGGNK